MNGACRHALVGALCLLAAASCGAASASTGDVIYSAPRAHLDAAQMQFGSSLRQCGAAHVVLYDPTLDQTEELERTGASPAAEEQARHWGREVAGSAACGLVVPSKSARYFHADVDPATGKRELMLPIDTVGQEPALQPGWLGLLFAPALNVSASYTMAGLAEAIREAPQGATLHKISYGESGWVDLCLLGGVQSQLAEGTPADVLLSFDARKTTPNRDVLEKQVWGRVDGTLTQVGEALEIAQGRQLTLNLAVIEPASVVNLTDVQADWIRAFLSFIPFDKLGVLGEAVDRIMPVLEAVYDDKVPTPSVLSVARSAIEKAPPSVATYAVKAVLCILGSASLKVVPHAAPEELAAAGARLADYSHRGMIGDVMMYLAAEEDAGFMSSVLGLRSVKVSAVTAGATGSVGVGASMELWEAPPFVCDAAETEAWAGHAAPADYYRSFAGGLPARDPLDEVPMWGVAPSVPPYIPQHVRAGNRTPTFAQVQPSTASVRVGDVLTIRIEVVDQDKDLVVLLARTASGAAGIGSLSPEFLVTGNGFAFFRLAIAAGTFADPDGGEIVLCAVDGVSIAETRIRVTVLNTPPESTPMSLGKVWKPVAYRTQMVVMDPAWYDIGCLEITDRDGDTLTIGVGTPARFGIAGTLVSGTAGRYRVTATYQVDSNTLLTWHRSRRQQVDQFAVVATDGRGGRVEVPVTVTVNVLNTAPSAGADSAVTRSNASVAVPVLANDTDPDQDILTLTAVTAPAHGTAAIVAGAVTYAPAKGYVGSDSFTYTVADGFGAEVAGHVTVTILDGEPPVFSWDPPVIGAIRNDVGVCGAVAAWGPPIIGIDVTDNVGVASLTSSHAPGSTFPVGSTVVVYTAQDPSGNESSFAFSVDIEDSEAPVLHGVPAGVVTAAAEGETTKAVSWIPATATDNCGVSSLSSSHSPGCAFPIGTTVVTTAASDVHGNMTAGTFLVTIHPPLAVVVDDVEVTTTRDDGEHVTFAVEVVGGCPPLTVECTPESGAFFTIGATSVTVTAADACGSVVAGSFDVTVTREEVNHPPIARDDRPPDMTTYWILVFVLSNDEDPDGEEVSLVSIEAPPCGDAIPSGSHPGAIYYVAADCAAYKGQTIAFDYTIADQHGARAHATVYLRIPDDIVLPRVPAGGGD
ncbi:MAG: HYR domain-containing protein [Candidatus Bipolaricaulota bacterium]